MRKNYIWQLKFEQLKLTNYSQLRANLRQFFLRKLVVVLVPTRRRFEFKIFFKKMKKHREKKQH